MGLVTAYFRTMCEGPKLKSNDSRPSLKAIFFAEYETNNIII